MLRFGKAGGEQLGAVARTPAEMSTRRAAVSGTPASRSRAARVRSATNFM